MYYIFSAKIFFFQFKGFTKVLGKGKLGVNVPIICICESFSERAMEKIRSRGGAALLSEPQSNKMEIAA